MNSDSPLGRDAGYPQTYDPGVLFAIERHGSRTELGIAGALPFDGVDIWNAWELSWLDEAGKPRVATAEIRVPANSRNIVESKSLKLYLGSFAMSRYATAAAVAERIRADLGACTGADVGVELHAVPDTPASAIATLPGDCIDALEARCDAARIDAGLLAADHNDQVQETLHSHLLRSLCPVTAQPDLGSVLVSYRGPRIDRASLLRYIVSYRAHNDFHETCVERMFMDIRARCAPERLTVYARFQRRGGIDINPFRSDFEADAPNTRLWRQ